jgi:hypothetical protein
VIALRVVASFHLAGAARPGYTDHRYPAGRGGSGGSAS